MRPRGRQARQLARPVARATRWSPFLVAVPLSGLAMAVARTAERPPPLENLPAVAMLLAVCVGFTVDDGTERTTAPTPTPLLWVRGLRGAAVLSVALVCWGAALVSADVGWTVVSLTAGFIAMCCVALGLASVGTVAVGRTRAGLFAAVGLVTIFVVVPTAYDVSLGLEPTSTTWGHLYGRWLLVGGLGLAVLASTSTAWVTRGGPRHRLVGATRPARAGIGAG